QHGNHRSTTLDTDFLVSGDFEQIRKTGELINGLIGEGASVSRGENQHPVSDFKEALDWLLEQVQKTVNVQRYKGLGEMNPDQLWQTTMDPEVRSTMKVTLDDVVEADRMFTILMGDQVEPRRKFIEEYADSVRNLDV
ncbi:MAG TPA: DNA gyrase subunit B, partial [Candidatus Eisenbacteria bacterium]